MRKSFKTTIPVLFGYLPVGMTFGYMLANMGYEWWYSLLFAVFVYAGAAQFMALSLLSNNIGLFDIFILTVLLNFRHVLYGLSIIDKIKGRITDNFMIIFGLTDETYSIITTELVKKNNNISEKDIKIISALNYLYWIISCTIGSLIGTYFQVSIDGLEFVLTALFTILAYEQYMAKPSLLLMILSIFIAFFSSYMFLKNSLLIAIFISVIVILLFKKKELLDE